jgi:hypothetical protein
MSRTSAKRATRIAKTAKTTAKKPERKPRVAAPHYSNRAKISILPKGKENPRREGKGPFKRYAVLMRCKTVGEFLEELPEWRSTITRAVKEERIVVKD